LPWLEEHQDEVRQCLKDNVELLDSLTGNSLAQFPMLMALPPEAFAAIAGGFFAAGYALAKLEAPELSAEVPKVFLDAFDNPSLS
jgi:hypothetical protein